MNGQKSSNAWKTNRSSSGVLVEPQQLQGQQPNKVPYIPQPDYTPLPTRRVDGLLTAVQQKGKPVARSSSSIVRASSGVGGPTIEPCSHTMPRTAEEKRSKTAPITVRPISIESIEPTSNEESSPPSVKQRVWHHPQWQSSQFLANDWSAALMKRLSVEAQSHREQKILREANKELERFETEIESYLEDVEEEEDVEEDQKLQSELVNTNHESVGGDSSFIHTPSSTVSPAMPISSLPQRVHQQPRSTASSSSSQSDSGSERKKEQRNQTLSTWSRSDFQAWNPVTHNIKKHAYVYNRCPVF